MILYFFAAIRRGAGGSTGSPNVSAFTTAIHAIMTSTRFSAAAIRHSTASCQWGSALVLRQRHDMVCRIAQGGERLAIGQQDGVVKFDGPRHSSGVMP